MDLRVRWDISTIPRRESQGCPSHDSLNFLYINLLEQERHLEMGKLSHTEESRALIIGDSWVYTGDEVAITADQEVFVYDRLKVGRR